MAQSLIWWPAWGQSWVSQSQALRLPVLIALHSPAGPAGALNPTGAPGMHADAVPASVHIGVASAVRPGFALALAASADVAALRADTSRVLNTMLNTSLERAWAKNKYWLAGKDLDVSEGAALQAGTLFLLSSRVPLLAIIDYIAA